MIDLYVAHSKFQPFHDLTQTVDSNLFISFFVSNSKYHLRGNSDDFASVSEEEEGEYIFSEWFFGILIMIDFWGEGLIGNIVHEVSLSVAMPRL